MKFSRRLFGSAISASALPAIAHEESKPEPVLDYTTIVHGLAGPFVVAGFRMGESALQSLKLARGSMDLEVIHHSPDLVQWSCIVDGLQAATGASLGKMNLRRETTKPGETWSVVRHRKTGREVKFKLTDTFVKEYLNVPYPKLAGAGVRVAALKPEAIFTQS